MILKVKENTVANRRVPLSGYLIGISGPDALTFRPAVEKKMTDFYCKDGSTLIMKGDNLLIGLRYADSKMPPGGVIVEVPEFIWGTGLPRFSTKADASVVRGQYAIAYQTKIGSLVLATDFCGSHPLFYCQQNGNVIFSTDLNLLVAITGLQRVSNMTVAQYFILNFPLMPQTFYEEIYRLPPAHELHIMPGGELKIKEVDVKQKTGTKSIRARLVSELKDILDNSSAPAFHLSGGIDSALLCHLAGKRPPAKLRTITAYYNEQDEDLAYGRMVAEEIGADALECHMPKTKLSETWEQIAWQLCSPVMATGVTTFWLTAAYAASNGINNVVTGIGGDHPFTASIKLHSDERISDRNTFLFNLCLNVNPAEINGLLKPNALEYLQWIVKTAFTAAIAPYPDDKDAIERFFFHHFLQEHLRMLQVTHNAWNIGAQSPFLAPGVLLPALAETTAAKNNSGKEKFIYRSLLEAEGSAAAARVEKQQMALNGSQLTAQLRGPLTYLLNSTALRIKWVDYAQVKQKLDPAYVTNKSEARMLWLIFNLHTWFDTLPADCIPPDIIN